MSRKLYRRGKPYRSLEEFIADWKFELSSNLGPRYCYYRRKLMHINFAAGMRLSVLERAIVSGILYHAVRTKVAADVLCPYCGSERMDRDISSGESEVVCTVCGMRTDYYEANTCYAAHKADLETMKGTIKYLEENTDVQG